MNRTDFQMLAKVRLNEAKTLLDQKQFDGAYYLAGYAVECGLKSCIAKLTNQDDFPRDRKFVERCYSHDFMDLLKASELLKEWEVDTKNDPLLSANWAVFEVWNESSRYARNGQVEALALYDAISDTKHGVMQWIERRW